MFINCFSFINIFIEHIADYFVYICIDLIIKHSVNMVRNLIDLDIKHFDEEDFSVDCHPEHPSNHWYLRFRFYVPDLSGSEYEFWFPTLSSCVFKLIQLLCNYVFLHK